MSIPLTIENLYGGGAVERLHKAMQNIKKFMEFEVPGLAVIA